MVGLDSQPVDLRQCVVLDAADGSTVREPPTRRTRWTVVAVGGLAAGRAVGGHLVLPLLVVLRGLPFLGLVLVRPNEATLAIGGAQASAGQLPWALLFAAAVVGAVASDGLSYLLGRTAGDAALARLSHRRRGHGRMGRMIDRSRQLLERHGVVAVAAARPTVITHGVVPVLAGVARVPALRFVAASTAGAAVWAAAWLGGAAVVADAVHRGGGTVLVVSVALTAIGAGVVVRECLRRPACLRHAT